MDTESESLRTALVEEVARIKDEHTYPDLGRAFQHWSAVNVLGIEDKHVADELEDAMGTDGGIDYFHVNDKNKTVEIVQAKFSEEPHAHVEQKAILEFYEIPRKLLFDTSDRGSRFQEQQKQYKKSIEKKYSTRLLFVTTASLSESTKNIMAVKGQNMASGTTFECFEIKDLIAYVGNPLSPPCSLRLIKNECFVGDPAGTQIKRMVSTVPATELKKVCESVGVSTLFSLNPRSFLGANAISNDIKETIDTQPERLWHYNNGISAICKHFDYDKETGIVSIENLKVVNGCQTMTTISMMGDVDPSASLVLRLSETDDTAFSEKISEYTNKQNSIKSPDLLSNHPYLVNLEKRFKKYDKFFFERKKGQRRASNSVHSRKSLYMIKNVDAARLKMAYSMGNPHLSMQLPEAIIFRLGQNGLNEPSLFSSLYKDADPRDFIVPHVFYHLTSVIKKKAGKDGADTDDTDMKNIRFLLKYKIGQYYVIGLIGKILRSVNDDTRSGIIDAIIDSAIRHDSVVIDKVSQELTNLVAWIAHEMPDVVGDGDGRPLYDHEMYYLRDPLRNDNKLPALYHKREGLSKYAGGGDLFARNLSEILNIPGARAPVPDPAR